MVSNYALVVEVHACDIDAPGRLRELRGWSAIGIEEVSMNSKDIEDVDYDDEDEDYLGEA